MTSKTRNILAISLLVLCGTASATNYGPEIVTDGGFDNGDASWTMGYSWQAIPGPLGVAFHNEGYSAPIEQAAPLTAGQTYRVTYTITGSYTSTVPYHRARLRGATEWATCPVGVSDGVFTCVLIAPAGAVGVAIQPSGGFAGVLDNVSLREVLP